MVLLNKLFVAGRLAWVTAMFPPSCQFFSSRHGVQRPLCQCLPLSSLVPHLANVLCQICNLERSYRYHSHHSPLTVPRLMYSIGLLLCMLVNIASTSRIVAALDRSTSSELHTSPSTACRGRLAAAVEGQDSIAILHCSPSGQLRKEQSLSLTGVFLPTQVQFDGVNQLWAVGGPLLGSDSAICLGVATHSDQQNQVCLHFAPCLLGLAIWCKILASPACCNDDITVALLLHV